MRIVEVFPQPNYILTVVAADGRVGQFTASPYLKYEAFEDLRRPGEFARVINGGYYVEWACGADLSADTIEARWQVVEDAVGELAPAQRRCRSSLWPKFIGFDLAPDAIEPASLDDLEAEVASYEAVLQQSLQELVSHARMNGDGV